MDSIQKGFEVTLAHGPLVLSGAVGTELLRRGVPTPLPLWSAAALRTDPDEVRQIHRDYVKAGARVVVANTFRTDRTTLSKTGDATETRAWNRVAIRLAREGVALARPLAPVFVGGSIAPIEDCYRPDLVPDDRTLTVEHGVKVGHLVASGAAFAMVETMNTAREARIALGACDAGNLPAMVSFTCKPGATLLSGESIADAVAEVESLQPMAILVNCCAPDVATEALEALVDATSVPTGVYANGRGHPDDFQGWTFRGGTSNRRYLKYAREWLEQGALIVGGCCGTDPGTIRGLSKLVRRYAVR